MIARVEGFELTDEATSGVEAVDLVGQLRPSRLDGRQHRVMDGLLATRPITEACLLRRLQEAGGDSVWRGWS
ncbi:MAG: hypothetical protein ABI894_17205 [Ilumatobacteraceae bacterium]